jgi:hypothetical protein
MNAAEMLDRVFDVYKKSFGKQLAFSSIVGAIAFAAFFLIIFGSVVMVFIAAFTNRYIGFTVSFIFALTMLWYLLWQAIASTGALILSNQALLGRHVKLPMRGLVRTVAGALSAMVAQAAMAIPYLVLAGFFLFYYFRFTGDINIFWFTPVYVILSIALVLIMLAGFFIYTHTFSFALAVAVNERVIFFGAVRRSFQLVKNDFWRLLGIRFIWVFIVFAISASVQGVLSLIPMVAGLLVMGSPAAIPALLGMQMLLGLLSIAAYFALGPLDGIMKAVLYVSQRVKREGYDLEIEMDLLRLHNPYHAV